MKMIRYVVASGIQDASRLPESLTFMNLSGARSWLEHHQKVAPSVWRGYDVYVVHVEVEAAGVKG